MSVPKVRDLRFESHLGRKLVRRFDSPAHVEFETISLSQCLGLVPVPESSVPVSGLVHVPVHCICQI